MLLNDTKQQVIDVLNASNLPIDAIYYVMKEVLQEVEQTYSRALAKERDERLQEASKENQKAKETLEQDNKEIEEKE